jgi:hypothetical protein
MKRLVANELPFMLSNSLIFRVKRVMLLMPIKPINKHMRLETKALANHKLNDVKKSEPAIVCPLQIYGEAFFKSFK